jgi:DNA-binding GntR family transcriptional regulator
VAPPKGTQGAQSAQGEPEDKRLAPIQARGLMPPVQPRKAVADAIRERIRSGVYKPGELLPPIPKIVEMTHGGASRNTVADAIKQLNEEGYTSSVQGVGVYVLTDNFWGNAPAK